jgi:hypothetical protein
VVDGLFCTAAPSIFGRSIDLKRSLANRLISKLVIFHENRVI